MRKRVNEQDQVVETMARTVKVIGKVQVGADIVTVFVKVCVAVIYPSDSVST